MTEEEARLEIARHLVEHDAKLLRVAHAMGYSREHTYRLMYKHELWALANKLRIDAIERKQLEKKHGLPNERGQSAQDQ